MQAERYSFESEYVHLRHLGVRHAAALGLVLERHGMEQHNIGELMAIIDPAASFRAQLAGHGVDVDALEAIWDA